MTYEKHILSINYRFVHFRGNPDILITGNSHSNEVVYGFMDASLGLLLKGDGKGNFKAQSAEKSGLFLHNATRGLGSLFDVKGRQMIIAPANADSLSLLTDNHQKPSQIIYAGANDCYAEITFKNGTKQKQEFYYGAGYLSQQERSIRVSGAIKTINMFDKKGKSRQVYNLN